MPDIEFEKQIKEMKNRTLLEFTARSTYDIKEQLVGINGIIGNHEERIATLEKQPPPTITKKGGAITAGVALGVIAFFTWLFNKLGIR